MERSKENICESDRLYLIGEFLIFLSIDHCLTLIKIFLHDIQNVFNLLFFKERFCIWVEVY